MLRIVRRDPFSPMFSLFDEFLKNSHAEDIHTTEEERISSMPLDLFETAKEYHLIANLPGIKKDDVKISMDKNVISIEASHLKEDDEKINYHHRERFFGKYRRQIQFHEQIDTTKIKAKMENGVLELCIPKEEEKPKTFITVE